MKYLFICRANRCRSLMAEGYFNHFHQWHEAFSAGTDVNEYFHGDSPPEDVARAMLRDNVSIANLQTEQLEKKLADHVDRIIVLCEEAACPDYIRNSEKTEFWTMEDPLMKDTDFLYKTRDKIKEKVKNMSLDNK